MGKEEGASVEEEAAAEEEAAVVGEAWVVAGWVEEAVVGWGAGVTEEVAGVAAEGRAAGARAVAGTCTAQS